MFDIAIVCIDGGAVAPVAVEGVVAFLDPARFAVCAGNPLDMDFG